MERLEPPTFAKLSQIAETVKLDSHLLSDIWYIASEWTYEPAGDRQYVAQRVLDSLFPIQQSEVEK